MAPRETRTRRTDRKAVTGREESLGGETNPRKEQRIQKLQHTFGFDWTRRWRNTLKSAGRWCRARSTDGEGATGTAREPQDPPCPRSAIEGRVLRPSSQEPQGFGPRERRSNGGRAIGVRGDSSHPSPAKAERERESPGSKSWCGVIRQGESTPRGEQDQGAAAKESSRPERASRPERIDPQPNVSAFRTRATGDRRHRRPPRGKSSGPSAGCRRNAAGDGDGAEHTAHGLRSARNEAGPGRESDRARRGTAGGEQAAAMRYGCRRGATLRRATRPGKAAHGPRWNRLARAGSTNERCGTNRANPRSGASGDTRVFDCWRPGHGKAVEVEETTRTDLSRKSGIDLPKPRVAFLRERPRRGGMRTEPGDTRKRGPMKDEKFQERKDETRAIG